jgi:hypothetical protein
MASRTKTTTTEHTERGGSRKISDQPRRFLGLFLAPFAGLPVAWMLYLWTRGVDLHWGPFDWTVRTPGYAPTLAIMLFTGLTIYLAKVSWDFTEHRHPSKRGALLASVAALGALFILNVGNGPSWLLSGLFIIIGWFTAIVWSIARLDVARNDKREGDSENEGPDWLKRLKGWRATKTTPIHNDAGEHIGTEVKFKHADGDTVEALQDSVAGIESSTGSPAGLSTAVGGDRADESTMTLMHKDALAGRQMLMEPSSPGGSIADGMVFATYAKGMKLTVWIGGSGISDKTPSEVASLSNYLFMGMARSGKTYGENQMLTETGTRRDVAILYLNKSKGLQDWRIISPITEVAVMEADADAGGEYRAAFQNVEKIMRYRQQVLGRFGIPEYNVRDCFHSPKWRTDPATGKREQMEPMPELLVHVGEADAILMSDGPRCQTIASKCLSLGIIIGFSMQRADHSQMPTGLRFNLGTVFCFGTSDDVSASFALSEQTLKAGAHPDHWKNRKQGYFYYEGLGVDDAMFPIPLRTSSDTDRDTMAAKILTRNLEWGPRMAKLDRGSAEATRDDKGNIWWDRMVTETDRIRREVLQQAPRKPDPANPQVADEEEDEYAAELRKVRAEAAPVDDDEFADDDFDFDDGDDEDPRQVAEELEEHMRETKSVDEIDLYPPDPETGERGDASMATMQVEKTAGYASWEEDDKPAARDRAAAIGGFNRACDELLADESLRDPADSTGRTVIVNPGMLHERYPFRSRPFYTSILAEAAAGEIELDGGKTLVPAPDLGRTKGKYRLKRDH